MERADRGVGLGPPAQVKNRDIRWRTRRGNHVVLAHMCITKAAGWLLALALACASALGSAPAYASCFKSTDPAIRELQNLVDRDATKALQQVRERMDALALSGHAGAGLLAPLYAVQARAYGILELDAEARTAATKGLELAKLSGDPVHVELLSAYAENVYDAAGMAAAIKSVEAARAAQTPGSLAGTCLLITQGLVEYRQDRPDLAIASLTQAYRAATRSGYAEPRIMAAEVLSNVMRITGDYVQALALNQEVIDWDTRRGATLSLSVSRFLRGKILNLMGRFDAAIEEFSQARSLSVQVDDTQGIAYADLFVCSARIELGQFDLAQSTCDDALRVFSASNSADQMKETGGLLARIDLAQGRARDALNKLNEVLDRGGADLLPSRVAALYQTRSRANAALHNYRDAYADLAEYARRYAAANDAEQAKTAAAMRARFETDREIERNALLVRELRVAREQAQRQELQLRWDAVAVACGVAVIALLIYFLVANRRYRQQLVKLASQDGLTGLPNRRRTAELASAALAEANAAQQPLTIAIIDMDHFKIINDRCGHATGDFVLTEFARVGREALRATDVLGRWGGEEFLLIMPETTLEVALANLERMRTLVFGIRLPSSGAGLRVSVSAGLSTSTRHGRSLDEMIARADAALYVAKNEGRDLVRVADDGYLSTTSIRRTIRQ